MNVKTIGRQAACDLVLENSSASRAHATLELAEDGTIWLLDNGSRNGTFLQRNGDWIRVQKVSLCIGDSIRFADREVALPRLTAVFGKRAKIQLGAKHFALRQRSKGSTTAPAWDQHKSTLKKPKRNPITGKLEEDRL